MDWAAADVHQLAVGHVRAVALRAHAHVALAGQHTADGDLLDTGLDDPAGQVECDQLIGLHDDLAGGGIHHVLSRHATANAVLQLLDDVAGLADGADLQAAHALAASREAVHLAHDVLLGHVH